MMWAMCLGAYFLIGYGIGRYFVKARRWPADNAVMLVFGWPVLLPLVLAYYLMKRP